jgi:uncharacterized protein (TIGR03000 family)
MSRWQAAVAAIAMFVSAGALNAHVGHRCREACATAAPAEQSATVSGQGAWDGGCACASDFGITAVALAQAGRAPAAPDGTGVAPPPRPATAPGVVPPSRPATPPTSPPKLHALFLVDDKNENAGAANKAGAAALEKTIRAGVAEERLGTVETLTGSALTPDRIRARIVALGVRPQDTVVCFYSGSMDYDESTRAFTLMPTGGGRIPRADLREALLARKARLTVLLTDAPTYRVTAEMVPPYKPADGSFSIERQLFQFRGVVDVHAAGFGENAFPRGNDGGLFTLAVVDELRQLKADGPVTDWKTLTERITKATDRMYVEYRRAVLTSDKVSADDKRTYREQPHQTPMALTALDQIKAVPPPTAAAVATKPAKATIVVRVPAGAKVFIEDRPTTQTGVERQFETAELQPGRSYTYAVRAEQDRDGRANTQTKSVTVRASETAEVTFAWPN